MGYLFVADCNTPLSSRIMGLYRQVLWRWLNNELKRKYKEVVVAHCVVLELHFRGMSE